MDKVMKENNAKELGYYFDVIARNSYTVEDVKKSEIFESFSEALYRFLRDNVFTTCSNASLLRSLEKILGHDIAADLCLEAFGKLFAVIKQGKNEGNIRLNVIFKKNRSFWEGNIHDFVQKNILLDSFKRHIPDSLDRPIYDEDASEKALGDILPSGENIEKDVLFGFVFSSFLKALIG